jgi:hypothetical protein
VSCRERNNQGHINAQALAFDLDFIGLTAFVGLTEPAEELSLPATRVSICLSTNIRGESRDVNR